MKGAYHEPGDQCGNPLRGSDNDPLFNPERLHVCYVSCKWIERNGPLEFSMVLISCHFSIAPQKIRNTPFRHFPTS